jgi:hypothetical protein
LGYGCFAFLDGGLGEAEEDPYEGNCLELTGVQGVMITVGSRGVEEGPLIVFLGVILEREELLRLKGVEDTEEALRRATRRSLLGELCRVTL